MYSRLAVSRVVCGDQVARREICVKMRARGARPLRAFFVGRRRRLAERNTANSKGVGEGGVSGARLVVAKGSRSKSREDETSEETEKTCGRDEKHKGKKRRKLEGNVKETWAEM